VIPVTVVIRVLVVALYPGTHPVLHVLHEREREAVMRIRMMMIPVLAVVEGKKRIRVQTAIGNQRVRTLVRGTLVRGANHILMQNWAS
jgi:uncharacterized membrane protein